MRTPVFSVITPLLLLSVLTTPHPTVPNPNRPTLNSFGFITCSLLMKPLRRGRVPGAKISAPRNCA
jgi:hypothetical protein